MVVKNNFSKAFGPAGTSAGYLLLAVGLAAAFYYPEALLLAIFGAFVSFTYSCTYIDFDRKRVKFANMLFGFFPIGRWLDITPDMQLGAKKSKNLYTTYSRGNRQNNVERLEYRVILYNAYSSPLMPLAKFPTPELAKAEVDRLIAALGVQAHVV